VIGHFHEPGLAEARSAVRIPVIGATMLHACALGRKIGLVTTKPVFVPLLRGTERQPWPATARPGRLTLRS
jgi:Asp/Glu/hydantoin racemase